MQPLHKLKAFCKDYRNSCIFELSSTDEWHTWGGYDINFIGSDYAEQATATQLFCVAYDAEWSDTLGDPIHWFIV